LKVFENRVFERLFGPERDRVTSYWRKLHSEELHNLYSSANIIRMIKSRRMSWVGHVARTSELRNVYKILVVKPEGKVPLRRYRHKWEDNTEMDLKEIGWGVVDWIPVAQDMDHWWAVVIMVMNLLVP
jgi:hypothetical protein